MSMRPIIEITADGSHTLYLPEMGEHYHSVNGAIQESTHVFIQAGLHQMILQGRNTIYIFEVGFGTGLNAFLSLIDADKTLTIHYIAIEAHPLPYPLVERLNYPKSYSQEQQALFYKLHEVEWGGEQQITSDFYLTKIHADLTEFDFLTIPSIDLVYFDAFAPDKQAEMWSQDIFDDIYKTTKQQGILVTYCAKGAVRRMMQTAGYKVERIPGPPGKREMLRATKE